MLNISLVIKLEFMPNIDRIKTLFGWTEQQAIEWAVNLPQHSIICKSEQASTYTTLLEQKIGDYLPYGDIISYTIDL